MRTRLIAGARWAAILAAGLYIAYLLLLTGRLALSDAVVGTPGPGFAGSENYFLLLRSVLFRRAVGNTCVVLALAVALALPAAMVIQGRIQQPAPGRDPVRKVLYGCALLPLVMPATVAAWAWQAFFLRIGTPLDRPLDALVVLGVIQGWRALPVAVLVLLALPDRSPWIRRSLAAAAAICWALADVSAVLVVTGGEPYNSTHTLTSWAYMTTVTGGSAGLGAAMALLVSAALAIGSGVVLWSIGTRRTSMRTPLTARASLPVRFDRPRALIILLIAGWLLLPLMVILIRSGGPSRWIAALHFLATDPFLISALLWTAVLFIGMTAGALAVSLRTNAGPAKDQWRPRLRVLSTVLASALLPVAFVPLLWRQGLAGGELSTLLLWRPEWLYLATAIILGAGVPIAVADARPLLDRGRTAWSGLIAVIVVAQEFGSATALDFGPGSLVTTTFLSRLADRSDLSPSVPAVAAALVTLFFAVIGYSLLTHLVQRRPRGDTVQSSP